MAKATQKEKAKDTITLAEFKAWLQGVEDMQTTNWAPDAAQWRKIREKISTIEEGEQRSPQPVAALLRPTPNNAPTPTILQAPIVPPASSLALPSAPPPRPSSLPGPFAGGGETIATPVRTPSIDTSDGNYSSAFT